jgi:type I restriction enzyme M protein
MKQYFTPRALISAIVEVVHPAPGKAVNDPACGTGGFLLAAYDYLSHNYELNKTQKQTFRHKALSGTELVAAVARLCVMNLFLHGIGGEDSPIRDGIDALAQAPSTFYEVVLTNPPFGKKSSITVVSEEGEEAKEALTYYRDDFWATTSNKQLNFLQHVKSMLKIHGRAAIVVPNYGERYVNHSIYGAGEVLQADDVCGLTGPNRVGSWLMGSARPRWSGRGE